MVNSGLEGLNQHWFNVLCLLGIRGGRLRYCSLIFDSVVSSHGGE